MTRVFLFPLEVRVRISAPGVFHIPSHLTTTEKLLLCKLALGLPSGCVIVEIGSYLGASSAFLAFAAQLSQHRLYCVDTWRNDNMGECERDTFDEFRRNTSSFANIVEPLRGYSADVGSQFSDEIDLLFVDGDHSYDGCLQDIRVWLPRVKGGGMVAFHDYKWWDGVRRAVDEEVRPRELSIGHVTDNTYWTRIS
jgi:predicted O-methyltransferase YrrM